MEDGAVADEMKNAKSTGERPTWQQGTNPAGKARKTVDKRYADPLNLFARVANNRGRKPITERELRLLESDKRAFEVLGFTTRVPADELKKAYKDMVKLHHPDANGGDRGSEDRLMAIIAAYNHLKAKGFAS